VATTQQLPRVVWKFRFPIGGFLSGMLGGFGVLLFLQQAAILVPTMAAGIGLIVGGGLVAVLVRNVAAKIGVGRLNAQLTSLERQMDAVASAPVEAPAAPAAPPPPVVEEEPAIDDDAVVGMEEPWVATHVVPSHGMPAWSAPDKTAPPVTQLEAGLELRVIERANGLAHVEAYNGWTAWVDGRSLRRKHV
jgi:hypothetical protein